MAINQRIRTGKVGSPGPYLAEVVGHTDPTYMGALDVALIRDVPNSSIKKGSIFTVQYMTPFYGVTSARFQGNDPGSYNDVQKSYGMWMVPPTVGTTVMVIFINGEASEGYWIGCVPDQYQNHMVPGIAASKYSKTTKAQADLYGTTYLPVAEVLKKSGNSSTAYANVDTALKPVHPFAMVLMTQGLLMDDIRGVTSSSARRDTGPSNVFGISTPGPIDWNSPKKPAGIQQGNDATSKPVPTSRLGGSTFVMDDGDITGQNELVRIRTRTGHQILLHNSADLIYIANSKGTAWIELTSKGKIDIYAQDSVSIRTEEDFNFRADKDINIDAGGNINFRAVGDMTHQTQNYSLKVNGDYSIQVAKNNTLQVGESFSVAGKSISLQSSENMNLRAGASMRQAGADFNVTSTGDYKESAVKIYMNGLAATPPDNMQLGEIKDMLQTENVPNTDSNASWRDSQYQTGNLGTIVKRAPAHEPWDGHEVRGIS